MLMINEALLKLNKYKVTPPQSSNNIWTLIQVDIQS